MGVTLFWVGGGEWGYMKHFLGGWGWVGVSGVVALFDNAHLLYIYKKKPIILNLFKIDTLNITMYILANMTCPLKAYVRLHNLISINIFFTTKDHSFSFAFFFIIVKRKPKANRLQKAFKNLDFFKSYFNEHFLHKKGL